MDLYSDLSVTKNGQVDVQVASGGWANIDYSSVKSNQVDSIPEVNSNFSSQQCAPSSTMMKPSSLSFKPRQTAASKMQIRVNKLPVNMSNVENDIPAKIVQDSQELSDINKKEYDLISTGKVAVEQLPEKEEVSKWIPMGSFELDSSEGPMYDPAKPNDYIAYCQERMEKRRMDKLHEENTKRLEEQEQQREKLVKAKEAAYLEGNIAKLQEISGSGMSAGRGRGRGTSNLPAWMTNTAAAQVSPPLNSHVTAELPSTVTVGQFDDTPHVGSNPSCVLLLENMSGEAPDYVLQDLAKDVQSECHHKYGPVRSCTVFSHPRDHSILTFVVFEKHDASIKAFKDLHERYFDGRKITAKFYDEQKYQQRDYER